MSKKKNKKNNNNGETKCTPFCIYFPDMSCNEGEWYYDEKRHCKIRKDKKTFRCAFDNHIIDWKVCNKEKKNHD